MFFYAIRVGYAFFERHGKAGGVRRPCTVMDVYPGGHYSRKKQSISIRVRDAQRLLGLLKQAWLEAAASMAIAS